MYNFKEVEAEAAKIVSKKDIKKAVSNRKGKLFSFLEGPPTANAPPGLHHLEVRTFKDIINKFRFMQGYSVPRKAGWDCHGLPVEVQIEKKLGLNSKKDILKYGEDKFIQECKKSVFQYIESWNKSTEKLGYWIDLENRYATLDNDYIESVWWSLKELHKKKLLYEAHKVVPFCPRCETSLSSHEVALGYKKIKEDSIIVKFKVKDKKEYLLVFTTTPWTLPSNVGIAVNPKIDYVYADFEGQTYVIAKKLAENYLPNAKILKEVKGSKLIGIKYEPLMNYFDKLDAFRLIEGDFVTEEDGTGLVHLAPAFGEVDYEACKKANLPFVQPVNENGMFTDEIKEYSGRFIKDCDKDIIIRLKKENKLFKSIKYEHDYPFCWRCDTPLMYYAIKSWFIQVTKYKDRLIELNKEINWTPKHIRDGRFGEWLNNVKDWALSRKKFWGTPLPVWRCSCGNEEIIGSVKELKEKSSIKIFDEEIDLHKPWIDYVKLKCVECGKQMSRVSDVIDCWYDSGSASFAQFHYPFENKAEFKKRFPYDFVAEAIDQTRGWFYTLHVLGTILFDSPAYKNVVCAGHIIDSKGEKMSKSKGNILDPDKVLDEVGVDATRLQFCRVDIGDFKKFGTDIVKKETLPFFNTLWNTYQFYQQLSGTGKSDRIEDRWILSRLNSTIKTSTEALENYQIEKGFLPIVDFVVNDFSKTYIKIVRDREDGNVKKVCGEVLDKISRMLAPYAPNISDVIYQGFDKKSVHLSKWPEADKKKLDGKLEDNFVKMMQIIERGLSERDKLKIGLKWPLARVSIKSNVKLGKEFEEIIMAQLNVKKIEFKNSKENVELVELDEKMTPELEAEGFARELARRVQAERKTKGMKKEDRIGLEIFTDKELKKMLEKWKNFLEDRTGSKIKFTENRREDMILLEVRNRQICFSFQ